MNFSANDYLGLAADPRLAAAADRAAHRDGWGSGASPLVTGRSAWHAQLEERIARFERTEAALLFPSGFAANAGVIPALVRRGDAIFADEKNHASLIDGCRLAGADRHVYPHADAAALGAMLHADRLRAGEARRRLIVTDGLFSMDGDLAPLPELARLAIEYRAMLLIDEAHASGVFGRTGRGATEHFAPSCDALRRAAVIRIGTLSKAFGSHGGFVCGGRDLIDWLANRARTYVYSTAAPAAVAAAGVAGLDAVDQHPNRGAELLGRARRLREQLQAAGLDTGGGSPDSQIIPVRVGDPAEAVRWAGELQLGGVVAPAIRPPSVPPGESLLRISLCWGHDEEDRGRLVAALRRLRGS